MSTSLLMIEDDLRLAQMVGEYLGQSGMQLAHCPDAASGLARLQGQDGGTLPELVILDLMLPDMDGLEVCRRIRALPGPVAQMPVLMLTAKGDPMDRVIGLEIGADDYLPKPFEPRELLARIRALLRRRNAGAAPVAHVLRFGTLEIDRDARSVSVAGQAADLTSYRACRSRAHARPDHGSRARARAGGLRPLHRRAHGPHSRRHRARPQEPAPHSHGARRGLCVCQAAGVM